MRASFASEEAGISRLMFPTLCVSPLAVTMQFPSLPAACNPCGVNMRLTHRISGLSFSVETAKTVRFAISGMPLTFTVSSGKGISSFGKLEQGQIGTVYWAHPLLSVTTAPPSGWMISTVSSGSFSTMPVSICASIANAPLSAAVQGNRSIKASSRLVAVNANFPLPASASSNTPCSTSSGESAGAMEAMRRAVPSISIRLMVMFKINSSFYATKSKIDSWFSSTTVFFDFFFFRSSIVRFSSPS